MLGAHLAHRLGAASWGKGAEIGVNCRLRQPAAYGAAPAAVCLCVEGSERRAYCWVTTLSVPIHMHWVFSQSTPRSLQIWSEKRPGKGRRGESKEVAGEREGTIVGLSDGEDGAGWTGEVHLLALAGVPRRVALLIHCKGHLLPHCIHLLALTHFHSEMYPVTFVCFCIFRCSYVRAPVAVASQGFGEEGGRVLSGSDQVGVRGGQAHSPA